MTSSTKECRKLGPIELTEYTSPVFSVIHEHGKQGHTYADDHQAYCGFYQNSINTEHESMEQCISDIRHWMLNRKLKMNNTKTEHILIDTQQLTKCTNTSMGNSVIQATDHVGNLGAYFDKHMSMKKHVMTKCQAAYAQLHNISKIRKCLKCRAADSCSSA